MSNDTRDQHRVWQWMEKISLAMLVIRDSKKLRARPI